MVMVNTNLCEKLNYTHILDLTYDLLEDRQIDDFAINNLFLFQFKETNRFHVSMGLNRNGSHKRSKRGKNVSDTLGCALCATFLFLPCFDVICDLLLNRYMGTWNLFFNFVHTK